MTPLMQRGFDDAKAGGIDPILGTADTADGRAYRDGHRQARRDAFDGDFLESECAASVFAANEGKPQPDPRSVIRTGWRAPSEAPDNGTPVDVILGSDEDKVFTAKRTPEGWEVATRVAGTEKHIWHRILQPDCWRPVPFDVSPAPVLEPTRKPFSVFQEEVAGLAPEPPKKRKPKPAPADDQLSLL